MKSEKILEKIESLFKEELWGRIDPKDMGISKFKILDDLYNSILNEKMVVEVTQMCKNHIKEHEDSIVAAYLLGLIAYQNDVIEDKVYLKKLIEIFLDNSKWAVVERIAEKILEYNENSTALKALATSLEKLGRNKEAIPVWEELIKLDRNNPDIAKKLAFAVIEDDQEKGTSYLKIAIEAYIKSGDFKEIPDLWNKFIHFNLDEPIFTERVERQLIESKELELASTLLKSILGIYRENDDCDNLIRLLKKILTYTPEDIPVRRELIRCYEKKYGTHSQFEQFLRLSKLNNYKIPVKHAIVDFEKNIIFDVGNFVYHRSWGIGSIAELNNEYLVVDFPGKKEHRMSIQMALQSLMPVSENHFYVKKHEDIASLKEMFAKDFQQFFKILLQSFNNSITLGDIKRELIPEFIDQKNWAKWWTKARTMIKSNPMFGISLTEKDVYYFRDKPVTYAEELLSNFSKEISFNKKLDLTIDFVNNVDSKEESKLAQTMIEFFIKMAFDDSSKTKNILSYFILKGLSKYSDAKKLKLDQIRERVVAQLKESNEIIVLSRKITSYDYKKELVNLIEEARKDDWKEIVAELLLETPVKIQHKYILNRLVQAHAYKEVNSWINRVIINAKDYPETLLWVGRNVFTNSWDYLWLDYSRDSLILAYFRIVNELKKIEQKGNRLKNMALELLFDNDSAVLKEICSTCSSQIAGKIYDIFRDVTYAEESQMQKVSEIIKQYHPDLKVSAEIKEGVEWELSTEKIITSKEGYDKKVAELNDMVNVQKIKISKDLASVVDVAGDQRENVEYNAILEKQNVLNNAINILDSELKKVDIIDLSNISTEIVAIGTKVSFQDLGNNESFCYTILGPWDADYEKKILSYRSPIAKALIGKKAGEEIEINIGVEKKKIKIQSIVKYNE